MTGRYGPRILAGTDWDEFVLRPGDRAGARGGLVRTAHGTWFDPPLPVPLILVHPRPPSAAAGPRAGLAYPAVPAAAWRLAARHELRRQP
ncbi:MAG TPA: hypothetical protein VGD84_16870 [Pseudonocardiaceae bacterium]